MGSCPTCKDSILNKTPSIIGSAKCNPDCPESVGCEQIIFTECISYNGSTLPCLSITNGMTGNEVLSKIEQAFCSIGNSACTVKTTEDDECCGYLADKLSGGDGITLTINTNEAQCSTITISESCRTWTNLPLNVGWRNINASYQQLQYSNIKGCSVKLRGNVLAPSYSSEVNSSLVGTLPVGRRPLLNRIYPLTISSTSPTGYFAGLLEIFSTGQIFVRLNTIQSGYKEIRVPIEIEFEVS